MIGHIGSIGFPMKICLCLEEVVRACTLVHYVQDSELLNFELHTIPLVEELEASDDLVRHWSEMAKQEFLTNKDFLAKV